VEAEKKKKKVLPTLPRKGLAVEKKSDKQKEKKKHFK